MSALFGKVAQLRTPDELRQRLADLGCDLPVDDQILSARQDSPLACPLQLGKIRIGNRWCIHPMEGWDANPDGTPSALTLRRWHHFGVSGAKWIWGGEAAAVQPDGRANPRQTLAVPETRGGLAQLFETLRDAHRASFGSIDDLFVGLQLTHSGRFCQPYPQRRAPRIAYHHPLLDPKFGIAANDASVVWTDSELERLIDNYVVAAGLAQGAGFQFVDVKCCHGYLLHEFLSARTRPGPYGGDFQGRTRLLRTIIGRIRDSFPDLAVCVRLSVFDSPPFEAADPVGRVAEHRHLIPYSCGFGVDSNDPLQIDLREPIELLRALKAWGVLAVNLSCGSPYYNPHLQRPAAFPPSDGYQPPEDPLIGVARQINVARQCKRAVANLPMVGSGYSYLQDYLPHVAQAVVREGWIDAVGLGRMVLSYPQMPAETLRHGRITRKQVCRTFSDCTTAPRHGLVSGCYPLDAHYKGLPEAQQLKQVKHDDSNG